MRKPIYWTTEKVDLLKAVYPIGNRDLLLSSFLDRTPSAIIRKVHKLHLHLTRRGYSVNQDFFKTWTPEMAYVLGYFTADGCLIGYRHKNSYAIGRSVRISSKDKQILYDIARVIEWSGPVREGRSNRKFGKYICKTEYELVIGSKIMFSDLLALNLTERKSFTTTPPDNIPFDMLSHYCRGVIDGDGTIASRKEHSKKLAYLTVRMYSPNKDYAIWFNNSVADAVGVPRNTISWNKTCWGMKYSASKARLICDWLYSDSTIQLDRKMKYYLMSDDRGKIPFDIV